MRRSWATTLAFVRLATKANVFEHPVTVDEAFDQVERWPDEPSAVIVEPTVRHAQVMRELLVGLGTADNLVNDAHLAALALEHRGQVVSFDTAFGRFPSVTWELPAPVS